MSQSVYQHAPGVVNALPHYLQSFHARLCALSARRGYCYAGNDWLAAVYRKTVSTIGRWLQRLERAGLIRRDATTGERRIYPTATHKTATERRESAPECVPVADTLRTTLPYKENESRAETKTGELPIAVPAVAVPDPLTLELVALGVTALTASDLVTRFPDRIRRQIDALPHRKCRNKAGLLIRAIENDYTLPDACKKPVLRAKPGDVQEYPRKPAERPTEANTGVWDGLSDGERERIRAEVVKRLEASPAWKWTPGKAGIIDRECRRAANRPEASGFIVGGNLRAIKSG